MTESLFEKRRKYVYEEFGKQTKNTHINNKKKTKLLKTLWKEAKRKFN